MKSCNNIYIYIYIVQYKLTVDESSPYQMNINMYISTETEDNKRHYINVIQ